MTGISALVDNFNDNTVNGTLWPGNYGTYQETGGRARVACDTGFNAYKSGTIYTLTGSSVFLQVFPPAATGAATSTCTMFLTTTTAGTDAGFLIDTAGNAMGIYLRSGFADAGAVFLTYSATDHAWLRLREAAGSLYWETSPNGTTWTVQRTAATPAWATDTTLSLFMDSHRDAGTNNWAEYDNLNSLPVTTIALGPAASVSTAQPLVARRSTTLGVATVTTTAQHPAAAKTRTAGIAGSTATVQPSAGAKTGHLGQAAASTSAATLPGTKQASATPAGTASTAQATTSAKARQLGQAGTTATPRTLAGAKTAPVGTTAAVATPLAFTPRRSAPLNPAGTSSTAQPAPGYKQRTLTPAGETATSRTLAPPAPPTHAIHLQLTGPPTTAWATHGTTTPWTCTGRTAPVDALSTEYYEVGVTWDRGTPTALDVQIAIIPVGHEPALADWHPAQWDTTSTGTTVAKLLVGPDGGALAPTPGRYRAWVNVAATPEHPVLSTAPFDIT
ncbi:hypothetical protein [Streptomyces sp. CB03911]|uniref:hypothetical protein n=1 Tax=Streptomyces sp. CB03911 TaxID=1804758 RepID=UPI00093BBC89|nr:hypothetical protein [Streptomyces sp. CB03911]OKI16617.1 hypothetical protein A6A07_11455 [Streptomyces sp. CB03911]